MLYQNKQRHISENSNLFFKDFHYFLTWHIYKRQQSLWVETTRIYLLRVQKYRGLYVTLNFTGFEENTAYLERSLYLVLRNVVFFAQWVNM
jgi:hypothetical protein